MSKPTRFGSAASALALVSIVAGCAAPQAHVAGATHFGGKADEDVGVATKALMALSANNIPVAISYGERAVAKSPDDAGFRALLGNAYFAAGRFRSAESAYKDSLSIYSNQPAVVLKLALAEIALGKKDEAAGLLQAARNVLPSSDYGLALALAGRTGQAVDVLQSAARDRNADATVRQNLALAYALAGEWTNARTIAAQDVPGDKIDARIQQWMQLARPVSPAAQVGALVGVTPAASDQGQPVQLALHKEDTRLAQAAPPPARKPVVSPPVPPKLASAAPARVPQPRFVEPVAAPASVAPRRVEAVAPAPPPADPGRRPAMAQAAAPMAAPPAEAARKPAMAQAAAPIAAPPAEAARKPAMVEAAAPVPAPVTLAMIAAAAPEAPSAFAAFMPRKVAPPPRPRPRPVAVVQPRRGNSPTVVQLGAYRTPQYVNAAWNRLAQRYPGLRAYLPMRARFDSPKGTFWRLSIQGFASQREAIARCQLLRSRGGNCFVRRLAGDAPVQMAMR